MPRRAEGRLAVALVLLALCAPDAEAGPIRYTITFTDASGGTPLPMSGSFSYDPDSPQFTDFLVDWNGITFDLTAAANSAFIAGIGLADGVRGGGAATAFQLLSGLPSSPCGEWDSFWSGSMNQGSGSGQFGFSASTAEGPCRELVSVIADVGASETANGDIVQGGGRWSISQVVPEPGSSLVILAIGLAGLVACRRLR